MTPSYLRAAREALGLTQSGLAKALRLSPKNGDRTVRIWETDGNTVPGPAQVAVQFMLRDAGLSLDMLDRGDLPGRFLDRMEGVRG